MGAVYFQNSPPGLALPEYNVAWSKCVSIQATPATTPGSAGTARFVSKTAGRPRTRRPLVRHRPCPTTAEPANGALRRGTCRGVRPFTARMVPAARVADDAGEI